MDREEEIIVKGDGKVGAAGQRLGDGVGDSVPDDVNIFVASLLLVNQHVTIQLDGSEFEAGDLINEASVDLFRVKLEGADFVVVAFF